MTQNPKTRTKFLCFSTIYYGYQMKGIAENTYKNQYNSWKTHLFECTKKNKMNFYFKLTITCLHNLRDIKFILIRRIQFWSQINCMDLRFSLNFKKDLNIFTYVFLYVRQSIWPHNLMSRSDSSIGLCCDYVCKGGEKETIYFIFMYVLHIGHAIVRQLIIM